MQLTGKGGIGRRLVGRICCRERDSIQQLIAWDSNLQFLMEFGWLRNYSEKRIATAAGTFLNQSRGYRHSHVTTALPVFW